MRALGVALLVWSAGCGPLSPPVSDAGAQQDAGPDGGTDAGFDAGSAADAGPCDGGFCKPERITGELIDPWDIVVDSSNVYWLEYGYEPNGTSGQIMRQPKNTVCLKRDAGCASDLNTQALGRFRVDTMALAGDDLCWTESYGTGRDVICQSLTTNAERFIARNQPAATRPLVVGTDLLWVNRGTSVATSDGQVLRHSLSEPEAIAPIRIASMRAAPQSVAVAAGHYVWTEYGRNSDAGAVLAQPFDGGVVISIASLQRSPVSVIECGGALYWANYLDNTIMRGTLSAESGVAIVANQKGPFDLTCDATTLYWLNAGVTTNGADGELWQANFDGSGAAPMVRGISLAWALSLDDDYVYYIAQGTTTRLEGAIWRIRKHR